MTNLQKTIFWGGGILVLGGAILYMRRDGDYTDTGYQTPADNGVSNTSG